MPQPVLKSRLEQLSRREQWISLVGSFSVHLVLLAVLGFCSLPTLQSEPVDLRLGMIDTVTELPLTIAPLVEEEVPESIPQPLSEFPATDFLSDILVTDSPVPSIQLNDAEGSGPGQPGEQAGSMAEKVGQGLTGTVAGLGLGKGDGDGEGGGKAFFGIRPQGKNVVFVVDSSVSMNYPFPGPAKTRFGRVKLELLETIASMNAEQKFFIIFFNDVAIPMPADRMMAATPQAQRFYLDWMARQPASSGTVPDQALQIALNLNPDVIYLLTDGQFQRRIVNDLTKANHRGVIIHTIGFESPRGDTQLRDIAMSNRGNYQFISAEQEQLAAEDGKKTNAKP